MNDMKSPEYREGQRYGRRMRQTWASAEDAAMPFEEWAVMQDTVEFIRECRGDAYLAGFQSVLKEKQPC